MIKVYCDKCGKELQDYDIVTVNIKVPEIRSFEDFYKTGDRTLCCKCFEGFLNWLKHKDNEFAKGENI